VSTDDDGVALEGTALHRGVVVRLRLARRPGPIVFVQRGARASLDELRPVRTDRGVTAATDDGRVRIDLVEHLLAAVGALGVRGDLAIATDDDELPLLDGGARAFADALRALDLAPRPPALRIAREASFERGIARYRFAPGEAPRVRVEVDFPAPVGREGAAWDGDPADFVERIAPARTFGWASEAAALRAAGRAAGVDLASVLVFDERGAIPGCRPAEPAEAARHKLLDLIGDLALHGGPPRGLVEARCPGHTATHAIVAEALLAGVLVMSA
jgi:UDP-3-O-[3-hydroxymyristoyl] N-acetylglucosamine deacetylase